MSFESLQAYDLNSTQDIIVEEDKSIEEVNINDTNDFVGPKLSSIRSYSNLSDFINNSQDSEIELNYNYMYNNVTDQDLISGIHISRNLTLFSKNNIYIDGRFVAKGLVIHSNCSVILQNITIKNCYSNESNGGAVTLDMSASLKTISCKFMNNKVYNSNGAAIAARNGENIEIYSSLFINNTSIRVSDLEWKEYKKGMGSAIYVWVDSNLTIIDSVFKDNNAYLTTILLVSYIEPNQTKNASKLYVRNCLFENNTSNSSGVFYLDELGSGQILDSVFRNNVVTDTGAPIILDASSPAIIKNCLFEGNSGVKGGAIHIKVFDYSYRSSASITDCNFTKNKASLYGGAIYSKYGLTNIDNCRFADNSAGTYGGAIFTKLGELKLTDSYFSGNSAKYGGALFLKDEKINVVNTQFVKNSASVKAGAVYSKMQNVVSASCSYVGNSAPVGLNTYVAYIGQIYTLSSYFGSVELTIKLSSPWKMPLSQYIKFKFSGSKNYKTGWYKTNRNGMLTVKIPLNIPKGTYTLQVLMHQGVCYSNLNKFTVYKAPAKLKVKKLTTPYKFGNEYKIRAYNSKTGKYISGAKLTAKIYTGKNYQTKTLTCDDKGYAYISTKYLSLGKHKLKITAANKNIKLSKVKSSIKIKKVKAVLSAPKKVKKSLKIPVTVKCKGTKKPIKKTKLYLRTYYGKYFKVHKIKTDSDGVFKISTKKLSKGKHKFALVLKNNNFKIAKKFKVKIK